MDGRGPLRTCAFSFCNSCRGQRIAALPVPSVPISNSAARAHHQSAVHYHQSATASASHSLLLISDGAPEWVAPPSHSPPQGLGRGLAPHLLGVLSARQRARGVAESFNYECGAGQCGGDRQHHCVVVSACAGVWMHQQTRAGRGPPAGPPRSAALGLLIPRAWAPGRRYISNIGVIILNKYLLSIYGFK